MNNLVEITQDLLYDTSIYDVIVHETNYPDDLSIYKDMQLVENRLKKIRLAKKEIQSLCIISNSKRYYTAEAGNKLRLSDIIHYDELYGLAENSAGKPVWHTKYDAENDKSDVFLARMIYNQNSFRPIALLVVHLNSDYIYDLCKETISNELQTISVFSGNDEVIIAEQNNKKMFNSDIFDNINSESGGFTDELNKNLVLYDTIKPTNWKIVSTISFEQLYKEITYLRNIIIILCIITFIILWIISTLTSINIINPIYKLADAMKRIKEKVEFTPVKVDRSDELGMLVVSYNEMAERISYLMNQVYREQLVRKEAEIKALQSQINPHFLFNVLESINWMAHLNGVSEISKMVTSLSKIMDVSIGRDNEIITLEKEIGYIELYISIQKQRFRENLVFVKDIDETTLNVGILRLLIQPLIENAIYHGIEKITGQGIITLMIKRHGDEVHITVKDNGNGFSEAEITELLKMLALSNNEYFEQPHTGKRKSIGIENVNRRVKLFYGEKYSIVIKNHSEGGSEVTIVIPYQDEKSE